MYRVVQPWGPDKCGQATLLSEHTSARDAFAEIDRLAAEMVRTWTSSDALELIVVDRDGQHVERLDRH